MDKEQIEYANRTLRHIRRVQDHMLFLLVNHSGKLELTFDEQRQLFRNAVRHDQSKWTDEQFDPYCDKFTRKVDSPLFDDAWRAHCAAENHHYQSGRWIGKLELIEICCDLQAMADEFGEGSAFLFWDTKWRPDFHKWLNSEKSIDTEVRRQMSDDYQWWMSMLRMTQVFQMLNRKATEED